jgi:hypothetical protein
MLVLGEKMVFCGQEDHILFTTSIYIVVNNISTCNGMKKSCFLCMERLDDNVNQF